MSKSILRVAAWKVFLAFVVGVLIAESVALGAAGYFEWSMHYGPYPTLRYGLIILVSWTYPYLVGRALALRSRPGATGHRRILLIVLLAIVNNVLSVYYTETYGVAWPVVLIVFLVNVFCLVEVLSFPARELKSIRLNRRARFPLYWRELLLFAAWPVCVWWLQPTLTHLVIKEEVLKRDN